MLKEELEKSGYGFHNNEDGTFLVHYDKSRDDFSILCACGNCEVREDEDNYYIDLKVGLGETIYSKKDWSLVDAIENASQIE